MDSVQSSDEQSAKSKGHRPQRDGSITLNDASSAHAIDRLGSGFDMLEVLSEYRALRASVLRLWHKSNPNAHDCDLADVTRFNESIDQLVTKAATSFTRKVDQARDMFLAILSHDLRNPLHSISMSATMMPRVAENAAQMEKYSTQITGSVKVMARMISDLLDYTRTRLGAGMPVEMHAMNSGPLGNELFNEFRTAHPQRIIRFEVEGDLHGEWDVDRLRQAISNLMGNALQHGAHDLPVVLTLRGNGDEVLISVHNGGEPIRPGDLSRIFDPLVRGADDTGPKVNRSGSIGLGLYIAREVAKSHGGRIDVTSTAEAGTTFCMHLPRTSAIKSAPPVMDEAQIQRM
jgi:signal transduction histidine kinase